MEKWRMKGLSDKKLIKAAYEINYSLSGEYKDWSIISLLEVLAARLEEKNKDKE